MSPRRILLSFDVEEFDAPADFGHPLPEAEQLQVGRASFAQLLPFLDRLQFRATLFITAHLAQTCPDLVRQAAGAGHEIASHGYYHHRFEDADLSRSKAVLESLSGQPVVGFRRARLGDTSPAALRAAGYRYDASLNPTWIPGRYNHLRAPRTPREDAGLLHLPVSVTPRWRFPLFWLTFKNFPLPLIKAASARTLRADGHLSLFFHPWELLDLSAYRLPWYVKRHHGPPLVARLERYLRWLGARAEYVTMGEFAGGVPGAEASKPQPNPATNRPNAHQPNDPA